jgi:DNA mismatch repair protein MutS
MSSMYDQYIKAYKFHSEKYGPNTAIFMLVGGFYELYDIVDPATRAGSTSMRRAVELLGIALTTKKGDAPGNRDGYFAGFPESALHKFAGMLTRENWTVAVLDQVRDSRGAVQKQRFTARILSPGTHLEALSQSTDTFYLAGVWLEEAAWGSRDPPSFAAVALDLSTGSVTTFQGRAAGKDTAWCADDLLHFFQVHPPKEVLVWWDGDHVGAPAEDLLRRVFGCGSALVHRIQADARSQGGLTSAIVREDYLRKAFQARGLLPVRELLGIGGEPRVERALTNLLQFVEDHHPSAIQKLRLPIAWSPQDSMFLGNHALTQLNMTMWREEDSVLGMFLRTNTLMGKRAMRGRLLYPVAAPATLEARYSQIDWVLARSPADLGDLEVTLRQIHDLPRLHRRLAMASVTPADILLLDQSYCSATRLSELVTASPLEMPPPLKDGFAAYQQLFATIFDVEKARGADGVNVFCLQEAMAPNVTAAETAIVAAMAQIHSILRAFENWVGVDAGSLRPDWKEASVVIGATKANMTIVRDKLRREPPGAATGFTEFTGAEVHVKKSSSSLELPRVNTLYRKMLGLREELAAAVREELPPLCDTLLQDHAPTLDALEEWIGAVDVAMTLARVARERNFCRPVLVDAEASGIDCVGLRHPLIEAQQTRTEYVRHNVALGAGAAAGAPGWLVYGMNASGKSSLMKAVGIAVLLAQCGSFVPASRFHITPFRALFTRILNTDDLWAGLSSFAVEMTELREALARADKWSLVLGDELCSGTESRSATALVGATLATFDKRGVRYIFATHLHELQTLRTVKELPGLRTWHLKVHHDPATDRLVYERTLTPGSGDDTYGLEVAKAMAVPLEVLDLAHQIRRELKGTVTEAEAPKSKWNAAIQRRECEVCGAGIVKDLEVHHIQPRAEAVGGRLGDGSAMNGLRNLVVVCETCHDKHHAGVLTIGGVKQTSDGPQREVVDLSQFAYQGSTTAPATRAASGGLTEEQVEKVREYIRKYPSCPPARLLFDLKEKEEIVITQQRLRAIRASLSSAPA